MKVLLILWAAMWFTGCGPPNGKGEQGTALPALIPVPSLMNAGQGYFLLTKAHQINGTEALHQEIILLKEYLDPIIPLDINALGNKQKGVSLSMDPSEGHSDESYSLVISEELGVHIIGTTAKGVSQGIQTLRQVMMQATRSEAGVVLPAVSISDTPRFQHRGMLFDPCRHFFSKDVVKKYIDLLALYKMNTLHWHLTEDQGWRIAIDKYPRLTEVGAWRQDSSGTYGGYYSKTDVREIVKYAEQRHIQVIPEIELPGHSQAAIAAYPNLSCTGEQVDVANEWGVFKEIYCAGNDSVFTFLEDVLIEVMELFPSEFIHIGGDEAPKSRWELCGKCQERIKNKDLADEHELQSWFIRRIEKFLAEHGRTLIGWDEILEGGLAETAVVQSWRGMEGGIEAVKHGNRVIMSPTSHCYFDYGSDATDMEKVYSFDPIPDGLSKEQEKLILGGECNLWSEHIPTEDELDRKTFPRLLAMSEVLWSYPQDRDYGEFKTRVQAHHPILEKLDVRFGLETVPVKIELMNIEDPVIRMTQLVDGVVIHWTSDGSSPTPSSPTISGDIPLSEDLYLKAQAFRENDPIDIPVEFKAAKHLALGANYTIDTTYSKWYTAGGPDALTNGVLGTINFRDGHWQGYWGMPFQIDMDLGDSRAVHSIGANFYHYSNAWILLPRRMEIRTSVDGSNWTIWARPNSDVLLTDERQLIRYMGSTSNKHQLVRHIRIQIEPLDRMPSWHEAAGEPVWTFIDEVIVR